MTYPAPISRTLRTFVNDKWLATAENEWTLADGMDALAIVRRRADGRFSYNAAGMLGKGYGSITAAMLAAEGALGI